MDQPDLFETEAARSLGSTAARFSALHPERGLQGTAGFHRSVAELRPVQRHAVTSAETWTHHAARRKGLGMDSPCAR